MYAWLCHTIRIIYGHEGFGSNLKGRTIKKELELFCSFRSLSLSSCVCVYACVFARERVNIQYILKKIEKWIFASFFIHSIIVRCHVCTIIHHHHIAWHLCVCVCLLFKAHGLAGGLACMYMESGIMNYALKIWKFSPIKFVDNRKCSKTAAQKSKCIFRSVFFGDVTTGSAHIHDRCHFFTILSPHASSSNLNTRRAFFCHVIILIHFNIFLFFF